MAMGNKGKRGGSAEQSEERGLEMRVSTRRLAQPVQSDAARRTLEDLTL